MGKELTLSEAKEKYRVRKAFVISIEDKPYQVYNIEGYEHKIGEMNGTPTTWWLDYSSDPVRGEVTPERPLIPYVDKCTNRICWEIKFKQRNYMKHKWDDWDLRRSGTCEILANGKKIYSFGSFDVGYALSKAQYLMVNLMEHPYDFLNPENEIDRKIWYYGLPAKVKPSDCYPGEIRIIPDCTDTTPERWWKEYENRRKTVDFKSEKNETEWEKQDREMDEQDFEETKSYGMINHGDALWDGMINWFRS
jgi:hypothetical protein